VRRFRETKRARDVEPGDRVAFLHDALPVVEVRAGDDGKVGLAYGPGIVYWFPSDARVSVVDVVLPRA
jgi:hypothetical protein